MGCPRRRGAALIRGGCHQVVRSTSTSTSTTTSTSSSRNRNRSRSRSHSRSITTATTTFQRAATAVVDVFQRGGRPSPLVIGRPDSSRWQTPTHGERLSHSPGRRWRFCSGTANASRDHRASAANAQASQGGGTSCALLHVLVFIASVRATDR